MKKLVPALLLAALLPLAGCATPYGYSPGAYAGYDGGFDDGFHGYGGSGSGYGYGQPGYDQYSDAGYYGQPYGNGAQAYGGYYVAPGYNTAYSQSYYSNSYAAPVIDSPPRPRHIRRHRCAC